VIEILALVQQEFEFVLVDWSRYPVDFLVFDVDCSVVGLVREFVTNHTDIITVYYHNSGHDDSLVEFAFIINESVGLVD
jgi:hypothetical protein